MTFSDAVHQTRFPPTDTPCSLHGRLGQVLSDDPVSAQIGHQLVFADDPPILSDLPAVFAPWDAGDGFAFHGKSGPEGQAVLNASSANLF